MRLEDVAEQYRAALVSRARPRTVKESAAILVRVIEELGVETVGDLSRAKVRAWRDRRVAGGASNKTINNALATLLAALACAVESEQIQTHPLAGLKSLPVGPRHQRRRPRALAEWEIAQVLAALAAMDAEGSSEARSSASEWLTVAEAAELAGVSAVAIYRRARRDGWALARSDRRGRAVQVVQSSVVQAAFGARRRKVPQEILVRALLETGARWGELTLATWADLDDGAALLTLRAENTKTEVERSIPIRRETCERLVAYRLECAELTGTMPPASGRIFLSPKGQPWGDSTNFCKRVLRVAYERAGLLERDANGRLRSRDGYALHVHTLRHTCCTRLFNAGAEVPHVQQMLGHASPQMTLRIYTHMKAEGARAFVEAAALPAVARVTPSSAPSASAGASPAFGPS
jgi:integrase